jgi:hypothetical protein
MMNHFKYFLALVTVITSIGCIEHPNNHTEKEKIVIDTLSFKSLHDSLKSFVYYDNYSEAKKDHDNGPWVLSLVEMDTLQKVKHAFVCINKKMITFDRDSVYIVRRNDTNIMTERYRNSDFSLLFTLYIKFSTVNGTSVGKEASGIMTIKNKSGETASKYIGGVTN